MASVKPLNPLQLLVVSLAGMIMEWQNRHIAYLEAEIEIIRSRYFDETGRKRLILTDAERALLARLGHAVGWAELGKLKTSFKPDTIKRWYDRFIAGKYTAIKRFFGRPGISKAVKAVLIELAKVNERWGGQRLANVMTFLGFKISKSCVLRILKDAGIPTAPERTRQLSWAEFLRRQWSVIAAVDFTTIEICSWFGLKRMHLLFAMELHSRKVQFVGMVPEPNDKWMAQQASELVDFEDGFLNDKRYLIADRAKVFHGPFAHILKSEGVKVVKLPARSPNLNAHMERFFRSMKEECLNHVIFFSEAALERAVKQYVEHHHHERHHQGLDGKLIVPSEFEGGKGEIRCRERLGGMLRYYYRDAA